jgi:hypothetical protein
MKGEVAARHTNSRLFGSILHESLGPKAAAGPQGRWAALTCLSARSLGIRALEIIWPYVFCQQGDMRLVEIQTRLYAAGV